MKSIVGLGRALVDACINDEDIIPILKLLIGPIEQGHNHFLLDDDQAKYILSRLKTENFIAGGSVANTLRYCSRNGKPSVFVGTIGNDELGSLFLSELERDGVNLQVQRTDKMTGFTLFCEFPRIGSKISLFYYGASDTPFSVDSIEGLLGSDAILHSSAYNFVSPLDRSVIDIYLRAQEKGSFRSVNISGYAKQNLRPKMNALRSLLDQNILNLITGNSSEFLAVVGRNELNDESLELIGNLASMVLMTMAEEGSIYFENKGYKTIHPYNDVKFPVYVVGAGDAYTSGIIQGLMDGKPFFESCLGGSKLAYLKCREVHERSTR